MENTENNVSEKKPTHFKTGRGIVLGSLKTSIVHDITIKITKFKKNGETCNDIWIISKTGKYSVLLSAFMKKDQTKEFFKMTKQNFESFCEQMKFDPKQVFEEPFGDYIWIKQEKKYIKENTVKENTAKEEYEIEKKKILPDFYDFIKKIQNNNATMSDIKEFKETVEKYAEDCAKAHDNI